MDQTTLVNLQIDEGKKLLEALKSKGFDVIVACWMKAEEDEQWYLYIASSTVDAGPREAYRKLHTILQSATPPLALDPFELRLVGSRDALVREINDRHDRYFAPLATKVGPGRFANRIIEGAYVYPRT